MNFWQLFQIMVWRVDAFEIQPYPFNREYIYSCSYKTANECEMGRHSGKLNANKYAYVWPVASCHYLKRSNY